MSNSTFVKGLIACLAAMLALGGAIALLNAGENRPEGVAEDWLNDVGDTTRKGVEADARERAEKIGPVSLATGLAQPNPDRKAAFPDLEVGKAVDVAGGVEVPFKLHARVGDDQVEKSGLITMRKTHDEWQVVDLREAPLDAMPALPSDGGPPPSSAPATLWLGALVGAAIIGVVTTALVRSAGRVTSAHAAAA